MTNLQTQLTDLFTVDTAVSARILSSIHNKITMFQVTNIEWQRFNVVVVDDNDNTMTMTINDNEGELYGSYSLEYNHREVDDTEHIYIYSDDYCLYHLTKYGSLSWSSGDWTVYNPMRHNYEITPMFTYLQEKVNPIHTIAQLLVI